MRTAALLATCLALAPAAAAACGWAGENLGDTPDDTTVVRPDGAVRPDLSTPAGMAAMSRAYRLGKGVPQDDLLARFWARRAAEAGDPGAMNDYAQFLDAGIGGPADPDGALRWFEAAAEAGVPEARHSLAMRYLGGRGAARDPARGEALLRRAAEAAHPAAAADLASLIWAGEIAAREPHEGCRWWLAALGAGVAGDPARCLAEEPGLTAADLDALGAAGTGTQTATTNGGS